MNYSFPIMFTMYSLYYINNKVNYDKKIHNMLKKILEKERYKNDLEKEKHKNELNEERFNSKLKDKDIEILQYKVKLLELTKN